MSNTIELLDAIGRGASLRHAGAEELVAVLARAQASEALMAAVATCDSIHLATEFGHNPNLVPQVSNAPAHEEQLPGERQGEAPHSPSQPAKDASARIA